MSFFSALSPFLQAATQVAPAIPAVVSLFDRPKGQSLSTPKTPPLPDAPSIAPDKTSFTRPGPTTPPSFIGVKAGMTPLQQRAHIATMATQGADSSFRDPAALDYYKNVAFSDLVNDGGEAFGDVLPVEQQFLQQVFGVSPRTDTTASFLSALERAQI